MYFDTICKKYHTKANSNDNKVQTVKSGLRQVNSFSGAKIPEKSFYL